MTTATVRREVFELVAGWPPPTDEQLATLQRTIGAAVAHLRNTTPQANPPTEGAGGFNQPTHPKECIS